MAKSAAQTRELLIEQLSRGDTDLDKAIERIAKFNSRVAVMRSRGLTELADRLEIR